MKKFFLMTLLSSFCVGVAFTAEPVVEKKQAVQQESFPTIGEIDKKIQELKDIKLGYEGKAVWHENQAQRIQFIDDELLTAKKHWKLAEQDRAMAKKVQEQIDILEKQKEVLLQKK